MDEVLLESATKPSQDTRTRSPNMCLATLAVTAAGAGAQTVTFTMFNDVDFVNFWYCRSTVDVNMELWMTVCLSTMLVVGSQLPVPLPTSPAARILMIVTFVITAGLLVATFFIIPATSQSGNPAWEIGWVLGVVGLACIAQAICGQLVYGYLGSSTPQSGNFVGVAQSGGTIGFFVSFVIRALSKWAVDETPDLQKLNCTALNSTQFEALAGQFRISGALYGGLMAAVTLLGMIGMLLLYKIRWPKDNDSELVSKHHSVAGSVDNSRCGIYKRLAAPLVTVFMVLAMTLSLFPGLISQLHPAALRGQSGWFIVIAFGFFQLETLGGSC